MRPGQLPPVGTLRRSPARADSSGASSCGAPNLGEDPREDVEGQRDWSERDTVGAAEHGGGQDGICQRSTG